MIGALIGLLAAQSAFDAARTLPLAPGEWQYSRDVAGSGARFPGQFQIRCDRASRLVTIVRLLPTAPAQPTTMTIVTDTKVSTWPDRMATLSATDPALDSIAYSRGRFIVRLAGGVVSEAALPVGPEVARSIEDCRN